MPDQQLALAPEASIGAMMQTIIQGGVTQENAAVIEKMFDLYERNEAREAERAFNKAFVALQSEMPSVQAKKAVPNRDGTIRYHFAPYEEIMQKVQPLLQKHGFAVTFDMGFGEGRVKAVCTLLHEGGHSRRNEFSARIGGGPPGATETQADGAANTYAKRFALCSALNIVIDHDDDARGQGGAIKKEEAADIRDRVRDLKIDEAKFLKWTGAASFEEITTDKLEMVHAELTRREK